MLGSKSNFFKQDKQTLALRYYDLELLLKITNTNSLYSRLYLQAFNFFLGNPEKFDGATIVKDLCIIPRLDTSAMLHDYLYVHFNVSTSLKYKFLVDLIYAKEIERLGGGIYSAYSRFLGLTFFGFLFFVYSKITKPAMTNEQKNFIKKLI